MDTLAVLLSALVILTGDAVRYNGLIICRLKFEVYLLVSREFRSMEHLKWILLFEATGQGTRRPSPDNYVPYYRSLFR